MSHTRRTQAFNGLKFLLPQLGASTTLRWQETDSEQQAGRRRASLAADNRRRCALQCRSVKTEGSPFGMYTVLKLSYICTHIMCTCGAPPVSVCDHRG